MIGITTLRCPHVLPNPWPTANALCLQRGELGHWEVRGSRAAAVASKLLTPFSLFRGSLLLDRRELPRSGQSSSYKYQAEGKYPFYQAEVGSGVSGTA